MEIKTTLVIDGKKIISLPLKPDKSHGNKNQFSCRMWLKSLLIPNDSTPEIMIKDEKNELIQLFLEQKKKNGKIIFTTNKDTGDYYSWATLTEGYGKTFGLTAGILFRKKT